MGDAANYGEYTSSFPGPSSSFGGSDKSVFRTDTNKQIKDTASFDGTITYSLYHQIS